MINIETYNITLVKSIIAYPKNYYISDIFKHFKH